MNTSIQIEDSIKNRNLLKGHLLTIQKKGNGVPIRDIGNSIEKLNLLYGDTRTLLDNFITEVKEFDKLQEKLKANNPTFNLSTHNHERILSLIIDATDTGEELHEYYEHAIFSFFVLLKNVSNNNSNIRVIAYLLKFLLQVEQFIDNPSNKQVFLKRIEMLKMKDIIKIVFDYIEKNIWLSLDIESENNFNALPPYKLDYFSKG